MKTTPLICTLLLLSTATYSLPIDEAVAELASELASCAAYYSVGAVLSENSNHKGGKEESIRLQPVIKSALDLSGSLTSPKKAEAQYELAMKLQTKTYKDEGFARLLLQYSDSCKTTVEHPDDRLKHLSNQK